MNGVSIYNETLPFNYSYNTGDAIAFYTTKLIPETTPTATYVNTYSFRDSQNNPVGCFFYIFNL
jgi:hypothetical protein